MSSAKTAATAYLAYTPDKGWHWESLTDRTDHDHYSTQHRAKKAAARGLNVPMGQIKFHVYGTGNYAACV